MSKKKAISFTSRELEVVKLICQEKQRQEIADRIGVTVDTVKFHIKNVYSKTGCINALGLYKYALKQGMVKPPKPIAS